MKPEWGHAQLHSHGRSIVKIPWPRIGIELRNLGFDLKDEVRNDILTWGRLLCPLAYFRDPKGRSEYFVESGQQMAEDYPELRCEGTPFEPYLDGRILHFCLAVMDFNERYYEIVPLELDLARAMDESCPAELPFDAPTTPYDRNEPPGPSFWDRYRAIYGEEKYQEVMARRAKRLADEAQQP